MKLNLMDLQGEILADGSYASEPKNLLTNFLNNINRLGKKKLNDDLRVSPTDGIAIIEVLIFGMADAAQNFKNSTEKASPVAIVIDNGDAKESQAAILSLKVTWEPGTEDNPEGSWEPVYVFGPEEVADATRYMVSDIKLHPFFVKRASAVGFSFNNPIFIALCATAFAEAVDNFLDQMASDKEEVSVELPGYFTASVNVIKGEKYKSLTMEEEISNIVKGDADLTA